MNRVVHIIKATGIAGAEKHLLTLLPALNRENRRRSSSTPYRPRA